MKQHYSYCSFNGPNAPCKCPDAAAPAPQAEPQYTNRHGERCSQACGEGRHSECTETLATCNCTCRGGHKTMHRYMNMPAAPAETARLENDSDIVGVCDDVTRGRTLHVKDIGCINWRPVVVDTGRETAGEMTAEQFWPEWTQAQGIGTPNYPLISRKTMFEFADAHAKQRVEQVEREHWSKGCITEIAGVNPSVAEYVKHWEGRTASAEAKVADLERERDTQAHVIEQQNAALGRDMLEKWNLIKEKGAAESALIELKDRLICNCEEPYFGAQVIGTPVRCERCAKEVGTDFKSLRTELREMREAAEKLVKRLRLVLTWSDVQEAGVPEEFSVELGELEAVLARKAGS